MADTASEPDRTIDLDRIAPTEPIEVVETFLGHLADRDLDGALALVDDNIAYTNVSLPTLYGRDAARKFLAAVELPGNGFAVTTHNIAADGPVVLTERTDLLLLKGMKVQIWVCGRFEVHDGRITVWRDYFDFVDFTRALVRGAVGRFLPAFAPTMPTADEVAPGR